MSTPMKQPRESAAATNQAATVFALIQEHELLRLHLLLTLGNERDAQIFHATLKQLLSQGA